MTSWIRTGLRRKFFCSLNSFAHINYLKCLTQKRSYQWLTKLHQQCKFIYMYTSIWSLEKGLLRHSARFRDFWRNAIFNTLDHQKSWQSFSPKFLPHFLSQIIFTVFKIRLADDISNRIIHGFRHSTIHDNDNTWQWKPGNFFVTKGD